MLEKVCTRCLRPFPATLEYFPKCSAIKSGLLNLCKGCNRDKHRQWRADHPEKTKAIGARYRAKNPADYRERCKRRSRKYYQAHQAEVSQRWKAKYQHHRDEILAYGRRYRADHPEMSRRSHQRWAQKNRERLRILKQQKRAANPAYYQALWQAWYQANKTALAAKAKASRPQRRERLLLVLRRWRERNREHNRQYKRQQYQKNPTATLLINQRRQARKRSLPDTFTIDDWQFALSYWQSSCAYCGAQEGLWHTLAMEHFIALANPSCPGTVPWNMLPACNGLYGCNSSKSSRDPAVWLTEKFGARVAAQKLRQIAAFFQLVRERLP